MPPPNWPSEDDKERLVLNSGGQFIYAVTAVRFVGTDFRNPVTQLAIILKKITSTHTFPSPFPELDELYYTVLSANPQQEEIIAILAAILLIPEGCRYPKFIELLLGYPAGHVGLMLRAMHSVLEVRGEEEDIRIFHTSFTDYLYNKSRSGPFYIDPKDCKTFLACRWTRALTNQITENPDTILSPEPQSGSVKDLSDGWASFCFANDDLTQDLSLKPQDLSLELDDLFRSILLRFPDQNRLLAAILLVSCHAQVPSSPELVQLLFDLASDCPECLALPAMHSLLYVSGGQDVVRVFHTSFADFLFDQSRSGKFALDRHAEHHRHALQWLRLLTVKVKNTPHIIRLHPDNRPGPVRDLVDGWAAFCLIHDKLAPDLSIALDNLTRTILSTFPNREQLVTILASFLLLPFRSNTSDVHYNAFFLGFPEGGALSTLKLLQSCRLATSRKEKSALLGQSVNCPELQTPFCDFLCDPIRSREYYIHESDQHDILARQWLHALVSEGGLPRTAEHDLWRRDLWGQWVEFCCKVDRPSDKLLSDLQSLDLATVFASSRNVDTSLLSYGLWTTIFNGFEAISSWLSSRARHVPPELINHFKIGNWFHASFAPDEDPSVINDFALWMALVITGCRGIFSITRRLNESLRKYQLPDIAKEVAPCHTCSNLLDVKRVAIPVLDSNRRYHISIQAGCIRIVQELVETLKSPYREEHEAKEIVSILLCSTVFENCGHHSAILPLCREVLSAAKRLDWCQYSTMAAEAYRGFQIDPFELPYPPYGPPYATKEREKKLLSWLQGFPVEHSRKTQALRDDISELFQPTLAESGLEPWPMSTWN
ncbi:hypothetical protein V5O48_010407 [Marasmius crinis-equi]|uniref:Uncharacterized protein n=1 Tax=Marasmius crinis-equi TaxID=585013 RepID=A0ABR3F926_9AGAR